MQSFEQTFPKEDDAHLSLFDHNSKKFCFNLKNPLFRLFLYFIFLLMIILTIIIALSITLHRKSSTSAQKSLLTHRPFMDSRDYSFFTLKNGLNVLLVKEDNPEKIGAAISVSVGSKNDPIDGTAHFLEHLLFMGSKKYEREDEFWNEISVQGGSANAFTDEECTVYYFDVQNNGQENFKKIIDIWSSFIHQPLISNNAINREINAVNSEYINALTNPDFRLSFLIKLLMNPAYPGSSFSIGSKFNLIDETQKNGINIRDIIVKFHQENYVSKNMNLVVYSDSQFKDIISVIEGSFNEISEKEPPKFDYSKERPDKDGFFRGKLTKYKLEKGLDMHFVFLCDEVLTKYQEKPLKFIKNLLNSEHSGGLKSTLFENDLISKLEANIFSSETDASIFSIDFILTQNGFDNVDKIFSTYNEYIDLIKKKGINKEDYDQEKIISKLAWDYKESKEINEEMPTIARTMPHVFSKNIEDLLGFDALFQKYDEKLLLTFIDQLQIQKSSILIGSENFYLQNGNRENRGKVNLNYLNERILSNHSDLYHLDFEINDFDFTSLTFNSKDNLVLPEKNPYIPTDLTFKPSSIQETPSLIYQTTNHSTFFYSSFSLAPISSVKFAILSPNAFSTPKQCLLTKLSWDWISYNIRSIVGNLLALEYEIEISDSAISIKGFTHRLPEIISDMTEEIRNKGEETAILSKKKIFNNILRQNLLLERELETNRPYLQAKTHLLKFLIHNNCELEEMEKEGKNLKIEDFVKSHRKFLSENYIKGLISGSISEKRALTLIRNLLKGNINSIPTDSSQVYGAEVLKLGDAKQSDKINLKFHFKSINPSNLNTAIISYRQFSVATPKKTAYFALLNNFLLSQAFNFLRTKNQLGYIATIIPAFIKGIGGYAIIIQGNNKNEEYMLTKLDEFYSQLLSNFDQISEQEFTKTKNAILLTYTQTFKSLRSKQQEEWLKVLGSVDFSIRNKIANEINKSSPQDLRSFLKDTLDGGRLDVIVGKQDQKIGEELIGEERFPVREEMILF